MKRHLVLFVALMLCWVVPANAWEVKTTGSYLFEYNYFARLGHNDLFGNLVTAQTNLGSGLTSVGLAGPQNGQVVVEGLSSKGSDGSFTKEKLFMDLRCAVNPAVAVNLGVAFQGDLNATGVLWASPKGYGGGYRSITRTEETSQAISSMMLNYAYGTMNTPLGQIFFGRRPVDYGLGWAGFHSNDSTFTGIGFITNYGPFKFTVAQEMGQTGGYNSPYDVRNQNLSPLTVVSYTDRVQQLDWSSLYALEYNSGPMVLGTANKTVYLSNAHAWPQGGWTFRDDRNGSFLASAFLNSFVTSQTTDSSGNQQTLLFPIYGDVLLLTQAIYGKWTNGKVFLNAEYDQQYVKVTRHGGRPISGWPRGFFGEAGILLGPSKVTLAAMYRSGHDRQGGILDVVSTTGTSTQTATQVGDTWTLYLPYAGAGECMRPYNFILGYYGTGNNSYDGVGNPTYLDFKGAAIRIDHAVASNLHLWMSYLYARRASNTGSWWGQYAGGIGNTPIRGSNVPDTNLGWELDAGINWKLLDNTLFTVKAGYWKPDKWFKFAYQDYSMNTTMNDPARPDVPIRVDGNRGIDPIMGVNFGFEIQI